MKQGAVIFAFDTATCRYTDLAAWSAHRIQKHLEIPVSVITDRTDLHISDVDVICIDKPQTNNTRYFDDVGHTAAWYNQDRHRVFELSPYQDTLLLDADYVVCSRDLHTLFEIPTEIVSMRWAVDVTGQRDFDDLNFFGQHRMPMAWATVIRFQKAKTSELVFSMMRMIEQNWQHYQHIYKWSGQNFRNDYALSIALNTVFGHQADWPSIPWRVPTIEPRHRLTQLACDEFDVTYADSHGRARRVCLRNHDFHAMNKINLGELIAGTA